MTAALVAMGLLAGCGEKSETPEPATVSTESASPASDNPLLAEWRGDYGGVPPFDRMQVADLKPALETAIAAHLTELDAIANQTEAATFENTLVAMERSGDLISRAQVFFGILAGNMSTPEFRAEQGALTAMFADYQSKIIQNTKLFARIEAVRNGTELATLRPDQQRLVQVTYDYFRSNGAQLEGAARERYAAINKELAALSTQFSNNVLADEEGYVTYLDASQLGGLPESFTKAAAALAESKGQPGKYAVLNTRSSMDPFLTYSTQRGLREQVWRHYYSRGDNGDERDNNALITQILQLRHERSRLLGFDNYAQWRLQDRMAKTPERAFALMEAVWPAAVSRVQEEVADMQKIADAEGAGITIEPWDYRYYAEKVRTARYDYDSEAVKKYLNLDQLTLAMFYVAGELFDFDFAPLPEGKVPVYHPDVKVWEVKRRSDGSLVGLWYLDPYARPGKRSGAWASSYRSYDRLHGEPSVLSSNNSNFIKPAPGEPVLVSWDDATTFFHEFGHALHALSAQVEYPSQNWGVRDYTEFQSQLLERWLFTEPVVNQFFRHVETGEPMPAELIAKLKQSASFNSGFSTIEYLASALIDLKLHMVDPAGMDPDAFERDTLSAMGMPRELVMRHRTPHFGHVFASEGYAAGYYGYLWAEVLTADAAEAFAEAPGGYYDNDLAQKMVKFLFAARNTIDPAEAYREFRGRDATIDALLRDRDFPNDDVGPDEAGAMIGQ
ncbi:MAG: M3 family metallopeptidase [Lysobacterales bacterium]